MSPGLVLPPGARRKLLFIAPTMPALGGNGLAMRAGLLMEALARHFEVTLYVVPVSGGPTEIPLFVSRLTARAGVLDLPSGLDTHAALISRIEAPDARLNHRLAYPHPWAARFSGAAAYRQMAAWLGDTAFDAVHVMRLYLAPLAVRFLREGLPRRPLALLDLDEDDADVQAQLARLHDEDGAASLAQLARAESAKFRQLAQTTVGAFHTAITCTADDAARLAAAVPNSRLAVVPNGYRRGPLRPRPEPSGRSPSLLLVGTFGYLPNRDAARYLVHDIVPRLRQSVGDLRVDIVGASGTVAMLADAGLPPGVIVHGPVPDLGPWYDQATVAVAPLRAGGGTRIKILEAFAYHVPVVATRIGAQGLSARDETHVLLADFPDDFAHACVRLIRCRPLRDRLAANAGDLLDEQYGSACIQAAVDAITRDES